MNTIEKQLEEAKMCKTEAIGIKYLRELHKQEMLMKSKKVAEFQTKFN